MKGQAAAGGGKEPPKGKKPEAKKLELAEDSAEPVKKKKPVLGSQKKVCLYSIVGKQFAELYNYTISACTCTYSNRHYCMCVLVSSIV